MHPDIFYTRVTGDLHNPNYVWLYRRERRREDRPVTSLPYTVNNEATMASICAALNELARNPL